jgi:hypothetical protein
VDAVNWSFRIIGEGTEERSGNPGQKIRAAGDHPQPPTWFSAERRLACADNG